jgi:hypothetical protein
MQAGKAGMVVCEWHCLRSAVLPVTAQRFAVLGRALVAIHTAAPAIPTYKDTVALLVVASTAAATTGLF